MISSNFALLSLLKSDIWTYIEIGNVELPVQATPSTWNPVAQLAQIAEAEVQGAPTAAVPSVQVQVKVA